jgi:hypothetical protein
MIYTSIRHNLRLALNYDASEALQQLSIIQDELNINHLFSIDNLHSSNIGQVFMAYNGVISPIGQKCDWIDDPGQGEDYIMREIPHFFDDEGGSSSSNPKPSPTSNSTSKIINTTNGDQNTRRKEPEIIEILESDEEEQQQQKLCSKSGSIPFVSMDQQDGNKNYSSQPAADSISDSGDSNYVSVNNNMEVDTDDEAANGDKIFVEFQDQNLLIKSLLQQIHELHLHQQELETQLEEKQNIYQVALFEQRDQERQFQELQYSHYQLLLQQQAVDQLHLSQQDHNNIDNKDDNNNEGNCNIDDDDYNNNRGKKYLEQLHL